MARKPKAKPGTDEERARIVSVILSHSSNGSWSSVTLNDIASEVDLSRPRLLRHLPHKQAALLLIADHVDQRVLIDTELDAIDLESDPKDRLFDIMMRRFDALQDMRDGLVPLMLSTFKDPSKIPCLLARTGKSMRLMLEAAGISVAGPMGVVRIKGLFLVYLQCLRVWRDDDSNDMSTTMSALDRGLSLGETVFQKLARFGVSRSRGPFSGTGQMNEEAPESSVR